MVQTHKKKPGSSGLFLWESPSDSQSTRGLDRRLCNDVERTELFVEIEAELLLYVAPGHSAQHPAVAGRIEFEKKKLACPGVAQDVHAK